MWENVICGDCNDSDLGIDGRHFPLVHRFSFNFFWPRRKRLICAYQTNRLQVMPTGHPSTNLLWFIKIVQIIVEIFKCNFLKKWLIYLTLIFLLLKARPTSRSSSRTVDRTGSCGALRRPPIRLDVIRLLTAMISCVRPMLEWPGKWPFSPRPLLNFSSFIVFVL